MEERFPNSVGIGPLRLSCRIKSSSTTDRRPSSVGMVPVIPEFKWRYSHFKLVSSPSSDGILWLSSFSLSSKNSIAESPDNSAGMVPDNF